MIEIDSDDQGDLRRRGYMSLVHSLSDTGHKSSQIPSNHLRAHLPSGMHNTGIILLHARLLYAASKHVLIRRVTMETRCFHKKLEFQRYPPNDFCTARYERKSSKKKFQTFQKPRKKHFQGRSWAKIGLRKTQPNVSSKRRDFESWTDN